MFILIPRFVEKKKEYKNVDNLPILKNAAVVFLYYNNLWLWS